ncbi:RICIN domain-containing protein [Phytoactinopolyspora limicola]|uniref:RICIN domain-containing protein n=1 Tax=Phytoactinopolyspora limicola TaxID=2715536 RepID=UPI00140848FC|nr:RICIN domain-containing protein [Phytoactinopolyspora limicola]
MAAPASSHPLKTTLLTGLAALIAFPLTAMGPGQASSDPLIADASSDNTHRSVEPTTDEIDHDVASGPEAAAGAAARESGERVEIDELRTETAQVFANPTGTLTLEQHALPVRVQDDEGEWAEVDTTLHIGPGGSVEPVAAVGQLRLSGGGDTDLAILGDPDGAHLTLGWATPLPEPTLDGSTAVYPEVMPGVDLTVTAERDGFTQLLIVHDREAAEQADLQRIEYPLAAVDLELEVTDDGVTLATDADGEVVYLGGTPLMWDTAAEAVDDATAAPGPTGTADGTAVAGDQPVPGEHVAMDVELTADGSGHYVLTVVPDQDMLTSDETTFPVVIDPSFAGPQYRWTHVNRSSPTTSYWNYDRNEGAKVGYSDWRPPVVTYRSFFQMSSGPIAGARIKKVSFLVVLEHSASCAMTDVHLWHTRSIDPAHPLTWNNSGGHWIGHVATAAGRANYSSCRQPAMGMEFASPTLTTVVQRIADAGTDHIALGLRAPNESDPHLWKRFKPDTAKIVIEYNNPPRQPSYLNFRRPQTCGSPDAPTPIATDQPQFSGVASDPDHQNVRTLLEIAHTAPVHSVWSSITTSGAAFSWPAIPAGTLEEDRVYSVRAYSTDGEDNGPWTDRCYFVIDTTKPAVPSVRSEDYPDGEPVIPARTTGSVTFEPATGETDVAEYLYGFQHDRITMRVPARADGSATVPITVAERTGRRLYVQAVDRAGNVSDPTSAWDLAVERNPAEPTRVRGDINGDGRPDVTAVLDQGFGRTAVWNLIAHDDGFHPGTVAWDTGANGGFPLFRVRPVVGDFDGDGRTDIALFREEAGRRVGLYPLFSDGNRYNAQPAQWTSQSPWSLHTTRFDTGDVTGDGRADIVVQRWSADRTREILVFPGADLSKPQVWLSDDRPDPDQRAIPLVADVDGSGTADLVTVRGDASCRLVFEVNPSAEDRFDPTPSVLHDSGDGRLCWDNIKTAVGDVDGDGRSDIVLAYEHEPDDVELRVFRSTGTTLTEESWWRGDEFDLGRATLVPGDFNLSGRDDIAVLYACCADGSREVWTFESTGGAFGGRTVAAHEPTKAVAGPAYHLEHRTYELIARHSNKCVHAVTGIGEPGLRLTLFQASCSASSLSGRFRLVPVAGTDRYEIRSVQNFQCAEVAQARLHDDEPVSLVPCHGGANQQVTLEYVDGSSYETVVRVRFAHSDKCASISGGSTNDRSLLVQRECGAARSQQWTLRPPSIPQLDGRFKVHAMVSQGRVLDVNHCDGRNIRIWDWIESSPCQRWRVEPHGDDLYRIVDPSSGRALNIEGCSEADGAAVNLGTASDSPCQVWRIEPSGNNTYSILAPMTGKSLDVAGCSPNRGASVIIWPYWAGSCQRWFLDQM